MWIGQVVQPVSAEVATIDDGAAVPGRLDDGRIAVVERQRHLGLRALGDRQLVDTARSGAGEARRDRVRLALILRRRAGADSPSGLKPKAACRLAASPTLGPIDAGRKPLAVVVEQPVVILGDDLVAAEDDDPAALLEEILERGHLGLAELGDVAEDDRVVRRQLAAR